LQEGDFVEGRQVGRWRRWHDTGALMDEGEWVDGQRSGEWKHYDKQGELRKTQKHPDRTK
jgi:antitoxin component YwqK of YwqJK toxin-antitoxin module